jgi:hypothetical protein
MPGVRAILDAVQSRDLGYVGRQVAQNRPGLANLSYHWWSDGIARLDLPVNTWQADQLATVDRPYAQLRPFSEQLRAQRFDSHTWVCDFSMLVQGLAALANLDAHLRRAVADDRPLYAAFEIRNVLYKVPFFNSPAYIERCGRYGVPVITARTIAFPERPYFDTMLKISGAPAGEPNDEVSRNAAPYVITAPLMVMMLNAVGIVPDVQTFSEDVELWGNHGLEPEPPPSGGAH